MSSARVVSGAIFQPGFLLEMDMMCTISQAVSASMMQSPMTVVSSKLPPPAVWIVKNNQT